MNVTYDYTGRKVDLEFLQTEATPAASKALTMTMINDGLHRRVTGIQKLVQRYFLTFMTPKGSVPQVPTFGSTFMTAVNNGLLQSRTNVVQYFGLANLDTGLQLLAEDNSPANAGFPADEKYATSYLLNYSIDTSASKLYLSVLITSQAGTNYTFVVPVS
jgi:hypothetical protein